MESLPNPQRLPLPKSAMGGAARTTHFLQHVVPPNAGRQHVPNHPQGYFIENARPTATCSDRLVLWQQRLHHFKKLYRQEPGSHEQLGFGLCSIRRRPVYGSFREAVQPGLFMTRRALAANAYVQLTYEN